MGQITKAPSIHGGVWAVSRADGLRLYATFDALHLSRNPNTKSHREQRLLLVAFAYRLREAQRILSNNASCHERYAPCGFYHLVVYLR